MTKQQEITDWIKERDGFWKIYQDSWDETKNKYGDYTIDEPKQIGELANLIKDALVKHRDELPVDFILESLTSLGDAPQVIYDDNGNWAISSSGMSPVVMSDSGKFEEEEAFTAYVKPEDWYDTIREALNHYLKED